VDSYNVIIIGGGPAGLAAGLYTSRAGLSSLLLEQGGFGGQMVDATIHNYPGFPDGISGVELGSLMQDQAGKYGLDTKFTEVTELNPGSPHTVVTTNGTFEADTVIVAGGSQHRKLDVKGESELLGRGVSYCATCDGFFFRDRVVAVNGGGDTAITDALELTRHASKVYIIHRREELRAGQVLQKAVFANPKIEILWNKVVDEIMGDEAVKQLKLRDVKTGEILMLDVGGIFVAVGVMPTTQWLRGVVNIDDDGYIVTDHDLATSIPGIFAAGDIRKNSPRQVVTAAGDGATAGIAAFKYIQEHKVA